MNKAHLLTATVLCSFAGFLAFVSSAEPQGQPPALPGVQGGAPAAPRGPAPQGAAARGNNPGTENGWATFQTRCFSCHGGPVAKDNPPTPQAIREMTPERIYAALTTGSMKTQAADLSDGDKRVVAEFMASRPLNSSSQGDAKNMPNKCASNPAMSDPARGIAWNGWGNGLANNRFQPAAAAGLTAAQVPRLKLKWAFGYPAGASSNGQPTIASGRVFVGSDNGFVYSLDAATGCVYWSFENGAIVRNAPSLGPVSGQGNARYAAFFGDGKANVFAVDAQTGRQLWKTKVDPHLVARITAATVYYDGKVIVPVSSSEEFRSGHPDYPCCTSRGSIVALDANTGKLAWQAWVVPEEPKAYGKNPNGVSVFKPAGGSVWNTPTIDPVRQAIYFGTGDATTAPAAKMSDAIVAIDLKNGKVLWSYQADENDVFMGGCSAANPSLACPNPNGPDLDIGNSPILVALPGGKRVLATGTKRGDVVALDPDNKGALLYRMNVATGAPVPPAGARAGQAAPAVPGAAPGAAGGAPPATPPLAVGGRGGRGSIVWGGAADNQFIYYGGGSAGLVAIRPATGERAWTFAAANSTAAPTVIPGVVFQGVSNGTLYAVSTTDGQQIWSFNTGQTFETVNKVAARGGAIAVSGAVVANGMLYIGSGYGISSGAQAGNVLLAFAVE